ncbi:MAG: type II secretion system secretin GspD [Xanthomonadales bacterium]|nr:type II secretion system secretin GspD [Xanthomonadales bacterium]
MTINPSAPNRHRAGSGAGLVLLCAVITLSAGCASREPLSQPAERAAVTPSAQSATEPSEVSVMAEQAEGEQAAGRGEVLAGSGEFFDRELAGQRPQRPAEEGEVVFNFEGQPIQEVIKAILGDLLEENYVIAPGVSGTVTFSTSEPIYRDQAIAVLEMLLSWNNAALAFFDGRYHVMPLGQVIPGQLTPTTAPTAGQRGYEVRVIPLKYIAPTEMQKLLQPYARDAAFVSVDNARNLMVLAGTRQQLENYLRTIAIFDVDWLAGMSVGMYPIERVEADTVVKELEAVFGEGAGTPLAGMFRFMSVERLNAIIVITPQVEYLEKAAEWIDRLDRGGEGSGQRLYVYKVKNVKATDLSDTLNDVFGGGGGSSSRRTSTSDPFAPGLQTGEITSMNDARRDAQQQRQQSQSQQPARGGARSGDGGVALVDGEEIRITAVEEQNSLLVRATPQQYDAVLGAIKRLDIEPLQVLIEVKVMEVTLTDKLQYGVQWFFESAVDSAPGIGDPVDPDGLKGLFGSGGERSPDRFGQLDGGTGFTFRLAGGDIAAFINLLEDQSDVRAIAAPSMMVLNNREANINVGTQIPVNSPVFNTGAGNDLATTRVQFRDTGTTLNVVPRVNPGGMVFMEVRQEVSQPIGVADANGNVSVNQRRLDTEIAVQSGETIVLGGLIDSRTEKSNSGIPGLSRLPLLGGLFGNEGYSVLRTELLVMITPTVVSNTEEAREVSREYREKMQGLEPLDLDLLKTGIKIPGTRD